MSNNAHIDKIFKDGLGEINHPGRDAMWQKMEGMIEHDGKRKKRRFAFIILFAGLLTAGFFMAGRFDQQPAGLTEIKETPPSTKSNSIVAADNTVLANPPAASPNTATAAVSTAAPVKRTVINSGRKTFRNSGAAADEVITAVTAAPLTAADLLTQKITADATLLSFQYLRQPPVAIVPVLPVVQNVVNPVKIIARQSETKKIIVIPRKISIEAIAGCDALRMNRKAGYYAGIRVNKLLEKGTVISVGINYTSHTVNDRYRLSSKPAEQRWETDAKLNDIRTVRVPIYFQRQLANSKFALMAGLVPTYVIDATVYNVPNSFTGGNPNQFRKFTLKDMNRFNILFGTGIKYSPLKTLSFELSGSYGFTSLVKNSYINQSRVNDNFKSIQAGVVFKLR